LKEQIEQKRWFFPNLWQLTMKNIEDKYNGWTKDVPHIRVRDKGLPFDFGRVAAAQAQRSSCELAHGRAGYSVWIDDREIQTKEPRFPRGHFFQSKTRDRLPKQASDKKHEDELTEAEYTAKVKEKFQQSLGEDGKYYYEMLGECYIHGMMDGEAMAHQNNEGIPTTVFEIR
jgi:hypothetical protein